MYRGDIYFIRFWGQLVAAIVRAPFVAAIRFTRVIRAHRRKRVLPPDQPALAITRYEDPTGKHRGNR